MTDSARRAGKEVGYTPAEQERRGRLRLQALLSKGLVPKEKLSAQQ
ncbi:hypothetical protein AB0C27_34130 [Nonomuraea sp. NPDC048882]